MKKFTASTVIIPFPRTILKILDTKSLRVRGDYGKILALIKLYGILRQKNLPELELSNRRIRLLTPKIALEAVQTVLESLTLMTAELDSRTKKMLDVLNDLEITEKGMIIGSSVRQDIVARTGLSDATVRIYFNAIEKSGYLSGDGKKPKSWCMVYDMAVIMKKLSRLSEKIENTDSLAYEMGKEAREWFNELSLIVKEGVYEKFLEVLNHFPIKDIPPSVTINDSDSSMNQSPSSEIGESNRKKQKVTINQTPSLENGENNRKK